MEKMKKLNKTDKTKMPQHFPFGQGATDTLPFFCFVG